MTLTKYWCHYTTHKESVINTAAHQEQMILVFANHSKEDVISPLTAQEIIQAQQFDASLKKLKDKYSTQLVENTQILCKGGKKSSHQLFNTLQLVGTTTIYSTLDAQDLKKQFGLQCTGKAWYVPSVNLSKTVMYAYRKTWIISAACV